jgi:hypothetical protein
VEKITTFIDLRFRFAPAQDSVNRKRSGSAKAQRDKACQIEQVRFIARLSEMRARCIKRLEFYGTEAVRQVYREYCHQQDGNHRDCGKWHQRPYENQSPTDDLNQDGRLTQQKGHRNADRVQYMNEGIRAARQLGIAVLHEAKPDNQAKRDGIPGGRDWQGRDGEAFGAIQEGHGGHVTCCRRLPVHSSPIKEFGYMHGLHGASAPAGSLDDTDF